MDLFTHVRGLLYQHITDSGQKSLALVIPKSWKYTVLVEACDKQVLTLLATALIDSGVAISLVRYSVYQHIKFQDPIQPTTAKLNRADGLLMIALGMTALHLRIADFKFTHNFVICDRLPDTEIIFGIDVQKKLSLSYAWDKDKKCYIQRDGEFLTYSGNGEQKATIGIVKSTLKIPPRHNGVVPIRITGQRMKEQMAYFIIGEDSTKGRSIRSHTKIPDSRQIRSSPTDAEN